MTNGTGNRSSERLLIALGVMWLLLGAAIVATQLSQPAPIRIEWETETEVDTAGFNIYRSTAENGDFAKLNETLIASRGSPVSGASYEYVDDNVDAGQTYFYLLEDVELDNSAQRHPVIEYSAPLVEWWVPVTAAFSVLCGLLLLVRGLRQERAL